MSGDNSFFVPSIEFTTTAPIRFEGNEAADLPTVVPTLAARALTTVVFAVGLFLGASITNRNPTIEASAVTHGSPNTASVDDVLDDIRALITRIGQDPPPSLDAEREALVDAALQAQAARSQEDVDTWAERLASDYWTPSRVKS